MKKLAYVLLSCCCPIAACDYEPQEGGGDKRTLTLNAEGGTGDFSFCDSNQCQTLPNPGHCVTLTITIDTVTGKTCETCSASDGSGTEKCGSTSVACQIVTLPEPDCVVCAYVNGAVVFTSCTPPPPDKCANVMCPAIARICPDGSTPLPDPSDCCGTICPPETCDTVMCADFAACPPGTTQVIEPPNCCGVCVPATCGADTDCPMSQHCNISCVGGCGSSSPDVVCTNGCVGVCEPDSCDGVMCANVANLFCPDGTTKVIAPPDCCGTCLPVVPM